MTLEQWVEHKCFQALFAKFKAAAKHQGVLNPNDQYTLARQCMIALRYEMEEKQEHE